jgi:trans-2,3-dihydro-3-hydroxyanthranilate isomerase
LKAHRYNVLDVFTDTPLTGNQLAVVHDADGVGDETMAAFARETRFSETTFVQSSTADGADYRNRIWTVGGEIPFAGHPSLGTAVAVALARGERRATYVQETGAGLQPIDVEISETGASASMLQGPATFGPEIDARHALAAVGLVPGDAHRELPPQVVSTGLPTMIVPVTEIRCVADAHPDFDLLDPLVESHGAVTFYLVCVAEGRPVKARMFSSVLVGGEDPATGSAAGPLCAYLAARGRGERVEITQGVEIRRPSRLVAELEGERVRVAGDVVLVVEGEVLL